MFSKIKSTYVFLIVGFMISACTINIAISSIYPFFKLTVQKNEFLSEYNVVNICKENERLNLTKMEEEIQKHNIKKYVFAPMNTEIINDEGYIMSDLWIIPKNSIIDEEFKINYKEKGEEDFYSGKDYVIIGENIKDVSKSKNNNSYIDVFKKDYEVIGEIEDNEYFASGVLISSEVKEFKNKKLNSLNILINKEDVDKIQGLANEGYELRIDKINKEPMLGVLKQIPLELEKRAYELIVGILNLIVFSYFFSNSLKKDVAIKRVLGASNTYVLGDILKKMVALSTIGTVLGIIMSSGIVGFMNTSYDMAYGEINIMGVILTTVVVFIISLIVTFLVLLNVIRFKIMKEIR